MIASIVLAAALDVITLSDNRKLVIEEPNKPSRGVVLLIPGGSTMLTLGADGSTGSTNFVIRTRSLWRAAGYVTAYMDDPSDLREPIARLRALARPVVLLSTSRGTVLAADAAIKLGGDGPNLLILTSPVTSGRDALDQVDVGRILTPTLIVENRNDTCPVSSPSGAAALTAKIPMVTSLYFTSTASDGRACQPLSPHGYLGIESEVIGGIVDWVNRHNWSSPRLIAPTQSR